MSAHHHEQKEGCFEVVPFATTASGLRNAVILDASYIEPQGPECLISTLETMERAEETAELHVGFTDPLDSEMLAKVNSALRDRFTGLRTLSLFLENNLCDPDAWQILKDASSNLRTVSFGYNRDPQKLLEQSATESDDLLPFHDFFHFLKLHPSLNFLRIMKKDGADVILNNESLSVMIAAASINGSYFEESDSVRIQQFVSKYESSLDKIEIIGSLFGEKGLRRITKFVSFEESDITQLATLGCIPHAFIEQKEFYEFLTSYKTAFGGKLTDKIAASEARKGSEDQFLCDILEVFKPLVSITHFRGNLNKKLKFMTQCNDKWAQAKYYSAIRLKIEQMITAVEKRSGLIALPLEQPSRAVFYPNGGGGGSAKIEETNNDSKPREVKTVIFPIQGIFLDPDSSQNICHSVPTVFLRQIRQYFNGTQFTSDTPLVIKNAVFTRSKTRELADTLRDSRAVANLSICITPESDFNPDDCCHMIMEALIGNKTPLLFRYVNLSVQGAHLCLIDFANFLNRSQNISTFGFSSNADLSGSSISDGCVFNGDQINDLRARLTPLVSSSRVDPKLEDDVTKLMSRLGTTEQQFYRNYEIAFHGCSQLTMPVLTKMSQIFLKSGVSLRLLIRLMHLTCAPNSQAKLASIATRYNEFLKNTSENAPVKRYLREYVGQLTRTLTPHALIDLTESLVRNINNILYPENGESTSREQLQNHPLQLVAKELADLNQINAFRELLGIETDGLDSNNFPFSRPIPGEPPLSPRDVTQESFDLGEDTPRTSIFCCCSKPNDPPSNTNTRPLLERSHREGGGDRRSTTMRR
jgi:hypothetical protein